MSGREGILMVFFDLTYDTKEKRREYVAFRKHLIKSGYFFIQESVYIKLLRNRYAEKSEILRVKEKAPEEGNIMTLTISLASFKKMRQIRGKGFDVEFFTAETLYI